MADDDVSSSSSDSDDEFLTASNNPGVGDVTADREALVRKKLLENFYGKLVVDANYDELSHHHHPSSAVTARSSRNSSKRHDDDQADADDLDSAAFDSAKHAEKLIRSSSTHALLETEERLALQVRTLDSTMQTLVYENYSRFIDATDAIRSIGVNVAANEAGLRQLTESMSSVDDQSRVVENALGALRDQVAEKIRVQRLLTRLDALLKLPATLQEQIAAGKYRTATRSYLQAASILAKHSQGFESLKSIETECNSILEQLKRDLEHRLLHWSGRATGTLTTNPDDDDDGDDDVMNRSLQAEDAPYPPPNMTAVFECAGALFMILQDEKSKRGGEKDDDAQDASRMCEDDLYAMAVAAAMRLLDRLLDSHLIQVQERKFSGMDHVEHENSSSMMKMLEPSPPSKLNGSNLVPRDILVAVLEGATLYGISFGASSETGSDGNKASDTNNRGYYLMEFVTEAFSSFHSHVRSILLEESIQANRDNENSADLGNEATQEEISGALLLLVQGVQELASGLVAPEVGINADFAANLLEQTMELAESMVRRHVDQKFHELRLAVVKDCLVPFATRAVALRENTTKDGKPALPQIVQIANSTLSDCLQLADDAIRSIFADSSAAAGDLPDLKDAVHASTYRFAAWLANAFEILAGGDSTDCKHIAEAPLQQESEDAEATDDGLEGFDVTSDNNIIIEDSDDFSDQELVDLLHTARSRLISGCDDCVLHPDFILAIVELCRLSEVSVPENMEQSFASHLGGGKRRSRGIFPTGQTSPLKKTQSEEDEIRKRFKLAGSRVLALYAVNSGAKAATILCNDLADLAMKLDDDVPISPSRSTLAVVSLAKKTAMECANIFGGAKRGGPVPTWEENVVSGISTTKASRKTGLRLDVERMFKESITIYPHPSEIMEASRNSVMFLFFKIVFRALFENARLYMFSSGGYRQIQVDAVFLKHILPHYLSNDYTEDGTNGCTALLALLGDVLEVVDDRCADERCTQDDDRKHEAREVVGTFMATVEESTLGDQFIIDDS